MCNQKYATSKDLNDYFFIILFWDSCIKNMMYFLFQLMLNKFVRIAGDILMQSLYVSYLNMITSLSNNEQASSYCFRLLSRNERTGNVSLSWDHFFNSLKQYYMSLRSTPDGMG